jgi:hypothetical protein
MYLLILYYIKKVNRFQAQQYTEIKFCQGEFLPSSSRVDSDINWIWPFPRHANILMQSGRRQKFVNTYKMFPVSHQWLTVIIINYFSFLLLLEHLWFSNWCRRLNLRWQNTHLKGFSPLWINMWHLSWFESENLDLQTSHG